MGLDDGFYFDFKLLEYAMRHEKMTISEFKKLISIAERRILTTENTSIIVWLSANSKIKGLSLKNVYSRYTKWCAENNELAEGKQAFNKIAYKHLELESKIVSKNGKTVRIYTEK